MYKASCWDGDDFYIGKTKRRLHDRKTEHFKALSKNCQTSAIADHITSTGHNIKWNHFEILATGRSDIHGRIKESLLIKDLKPSLNENVGSEKLFLYQPFIYFPADFDRSVYYQFFTIVLKINIFFPKRRKIYTKPQNIS